jgi:hypothetical protein
MRVCGCEIVWSDGFVSKCLVGITDNQTACYHHNKYFSKVNINGGKEEIWQSTPAPVDRKAIHDKRKDSRYMTSVYNPYTGQLRPIHNEDTD